MELLPNEVALLVLQHLTLSATPSKWVQGTKDLASVSMVCRWWRTLAVENELWHGLHKVVFGGPIRPWWIDASLNSNDVEVEGDGHEPFKRRLPAMQSIPSIRELLVEESEHYLSRQGKLLLGRSDIAAYRAFGFKMKKLHDLVIALLPYTKDDSSGPTPESQDAQQSSGRTKDSNKETRRGKRSKSFELNLSNQATLVIILGCEELFRRLLAHKDDNEIVRKAFTTSINHYLALFWASAIPSSSIVTELLIANKGQLTQSLPRRGLWPRELAMIAAAERNDLTTMHILIENLRHTTHYAHHHVVGACMQWTTDTEMLELLWQERSWLCAKDGGTSIYRQLLADVAGTPFWLPYIADAVRVGNLSAVRFYLSALSLEQTDLDRLLQWAIRWAREEVVSYLLSADAQFRRSDDNSLAAAVQRPYFRPSLFELLVNHGLHFINYQHCWALFVKGPVALGDEELCSFLVSHGADINGWYRIRANTYYTPLQQAAITNNLALARVLLKFGANPKIRHVSSRLALHLAKRKGHQEMADLIQSAS